MEVHISKDDVREAKTDSRGRFTLGSDYADKTVEIAVLEVRDE